MPLVKKKIEEIKVRAAVMSDLAVAMFRDALESLEPSGRDFWKEVEERDDRVDELEIELENACLGLLALQAPKASELRYVVAVTRLASDLERVGDHSAAIAKAARGRYLAPLVAETPDFKNMAARALKALVGAGEAFFALDSRRHGLLLVEDREIGALQRSLNKELVAIMSRDSQKTEDAVNLINVIRRVERVADHAKNIAALVPYVEDGTMARHLG
ncbi:MAG: phosphate signaling complex protein PhoU [Deltaproteobacteria bacterium]|jgi:phosphate transport system protein|nr:phosphate signaling complex protein PhoU [Deltaproteobacteria bacterium]